MPQPASGQPASQSHPLHALDRVVVDRLLAADPPSEADLVDAARLLMRYEGFPGAEDIQTDLAKALRFWNLSRDELQARTRAIWAAGYRPGAGSSEAASEAVGSGFDTAAQEG